MLLKLKYYSHCSVIYTVIQSCTGGRVRHGDLTPHRPTPAHLLPRGADANAHSHGNPSGRSTLGTDDLQTQSAHS